MGSSVGGAVAGSGAGADWNASKAMSDGGGVVGGATDGTSSPVVGGALASGPHGDQEEGPPTDGLPSSQEGGSLYPLFPPGVESEKDGGSLVLPEVVGGMLYAGPCSSQEGVL
mmetsp:Transcript_6146/g.38162  ORF Transcript_6146/g.38162 Transcript_6146/m.38162 type:complete len:113 (-) Transcript_6146:317-655(-)